MKRLLRTFLSCAAALLQLTTSRVLHQRPRSEITSPEERWLSYLRRPFPQWKPLNASCTSVRGRSGKCTFPSACSRRGGVAEGWCLEPLQVCCVASMSCGGESRENNSYFVSPEEPFWEVPEDGGCRSKVVFRSRDVCQLRLELEVLDLAPPTAGDCRRDFLAVSGCNANSYLPIICGRNSGQHLMVDVSSSTGPVSLCMTLKGRYPRTWRIKVVHLECRSPMLAPKGCIQYFTEPVDRIRSFSFDESDPDSGYTNNLNYAVCLRRNAHYCGFTLTADLFHVGENSSRVVTDGHCTSDFVQLPPGRVHVDGRNLPTPARLCGSVFGSLDGFGQPQPVTIDSRGPLVIYFSSNGVGPKGRGFKFVYIMNPCLIF